MTQPEKIDVLIQMWRSDLWSWRLRSTSFRLPGRNISMIEMKISRSGKRSHRRGFTLNLFLFHHSNRVRENPEKIKNDFGALRVRQFQGPGKGGIHSGPTFDETTFEGLTLTRNFLVWPKTPSIILCGKYLFCLKRRCLPSSGPSISMCYYRVSPILTCHTRAYNKCTHTHTHFLRPSLWERKKFPLVSSLDLVMSSFGKLVNWPSSNASLDTP